MAHPQLGDFPMQNVVPKLSVTPGEVRWVGPSSASTPTRSWATCSTWTRPPAPLSGTPG